MASPFRRPRLPSTASRTRRRSRSRRQTRRRRSSQAFAEKINALKLTLSRSVGEDDKLFGSVTSKEIENAAKAAGVPIDRKKMHLAEPLKALGTFEIPVRLMTDVTATLKVEVVKK